jgi:hypothetical protein
MTVYSAPYPVKEIEMGRVKRIARRCTIIAFVMLVVLGGSAVAQEPTTDEIARELSNPTSALMSLNSQIDYRSFKGTLPGASDQSAWSYLFQPVFPFPQASGANILFRPAIPVLFNQPVFTGTAFESAGVNLGNINFDLMYGKTTASGMLLGVGVGGHSRRRPTRRCVRIGPSVPRSFLGSSGRGASSVYLLRNRSTSRDRPRARRLGGSIS